LAADILQLGVIIGSAWGGVSWVEVLGLGFLDGASWIGILGLGFLDWDSWIGILGLGFLDWDSWIEFHE
jgi:hypothetical protein